ncbi:MAG: molybdopterin-dependent oxidoreductase [Candidatus Planktophila sp.]|nr:molybdopterin-dependent oxidoreductase [Candidatus Planktophila sp.]
MESKRLGSVFGPLAMVAGVSIGHLVASLYSNWQSPVISLGNRIIDYVPPPVKKIVINLFGTYDKLFLIVSILAAVFGLSLIVGRAYMSGKRGVAYSTVAAMSIAASWAALLDARSNLFSVLPAFISGGVTLYALRWLSLQGSESVDSGVEISRRDVLKAVAVIGAVGIAATGAAKLFAQKASVQIERIKIALPKPLKFLPNPPVDPALTTPGLSPLFTPNEDFYRIDTSLAIPNVSTDDWKLEIVGMVDNPFTLSYQELIARPVFELDGTIACVSNEIGGDLVGNARWLGVRLDDLIREAGPSADADQVMGYSVDGFTAGFPVATLDGRDAMIAIGMNGETLPLAHGYPARIIVPGIYGYVSAVKWLTRIELTRFDVKHGYWISRGWSERAPIKTASRIDTPSNGAELPVGKLAIAGVAWAMIRGISKVEVKIGNLPWREATLGPQIAKTTWRQWWIDWNPKHGVHVISVRATDGDGVVQPEAYVPVDPNGAEGWHTINVEVL